MALWSRKQPTPDPIFDRLEHLQAELACAELEQHLAIIAPPLETMAVVPAQRGLTQSSPFADETSQSTGLFSRFLNVIEARRVTEPVAPTSQVTRRGYVDGIPIGGTTATNSSAVSAFGGIDRESLMDELLGAYLSCIWASTCVDAIARTITAGGLTVAPDAVDADDDDPDPTPPPEVDRVQQLLDYCNPSDDIRQLMRRVVTDLLIFADSFTEVTWMSIGGVSEPVALWPLDCQTISIISDEHGNVGRMIDGKLVGYVQKTESGKTVYFEPHEVIHVKMDAPGASLYGVGPMQKALVAIKTWLFAAGLIKETMKRGDPSRLHFDWPLSVPDPEVRKSIQQYSSRNLGVRNIGNPVETKGNAQVHEFSPNKIEFWIKVKDEARDEILSEFGVPKRKAGVAVPGQLGGDETGDDKTFRVNTCGPVSELALEKFSFALCYQAFGVKDWRIKFGEVDWRDDLVVEQIRDMRLRNGSWWLNRYRKDIGEPDVDGGDVSVIVDRQNIIVWSDMADYSKASVAAKRKGTDLDPSPALPAGQTGDTDGPAEVPDNRGPAQKPGAKPATKETLSESMRNGSWRREYLRRVGAVRQELVSGLHD